MHVGLNLIFLVPGETGGMETYARELIAALCEHAPELKLTAFVNREATDDPTLRWAGVDIVTVPVCARNRFEWVRGEQLLLPRLAAQARIDLLHSLGNTAPVRGPFRRVATIHDLHYLIIPEAHFGLRGYGMRLLVPLAARFSHRVITDSKTTADDLVKHLRIPRRQLDVVPLGIGAPRTEIKLTEEEIRQRFDLGDRKLLLTLSAKRPHKNLLRLLEALALIPGAHRPVLVLPGYATPYEAELKEAGVRLKLENDTRFVGWISPDEVEGLYAIAEIFVFPSLHEGFAFPILEAMARGVPVCCANRGAMAEAAGDAAVTFDPENAVAISQAIESLLLDPQRRANLRLAGLKRAGSYTWARTAKATAAIYRATLT